MSTRVLKFIAVSLIVFYIIRTIRCRNQQIDNMQGVKKPDITQPPAKTLTKTVKDVIRQNRAIPNHYTEMDKISKTFVGQVQKGKEPTWGMLVRMGDIYARGVYPYLQPDDKTAIQLYTMGTRSPDSVVASESVARMVDLRLNPLSVSDRKGEKMNTEYAYTVMSNAEEFIKNAPEELFNSRKKNLKLRLEPTPRTVPGMIQRSSNGRPSKIATRPVQTPPVGTTRNTELTGGKQNTHDHGVTSATKTNISKLASEFKSLDLEHGSYESILEKGVKLCKRVHKRAKTDDMIVFTDEELSDCHHVISSLTPDEYSETGVSQSGILGLVLWKISTLEDDIRKGVEETLAKRISTGIERGLPVCATGKVSRFISVFEGVLDNAQKSVSISYVKEEIAQMASKVRDDFLAKIGPMGVEAYCSEQSVPEYAVRMGENLRDTARDVYVHGLNMSPTIIDPLVQVYVDSY